MCGVSVLSQKIKIKNRKHMRKIILISIAVLLLAGAGVATVAFSGLKATPEAQSVTEYIKTIYSGAKVGAITQSDATTAHQLVLLRDMGVEPSSEDIDRFLADTDAVIGQFIEAQFHYAGSDYLMVCIYEPGREKICHRFAHIVSK